MAKTIDYEFTRGDTYQLKKFRVTDNNKAVLNLTSSEQLYFTMKKDANSKKVLLQKRIGEGIELREDGYYHITMEPSDTNDLKYEDYQYDIQLKSTYPKELVKTLINGTITLTEEITWKGDE